MNITKAQRAILVCAAQGHRVFADGQYSVHTSFTTGEVSFGFPNGSYRACVEKGLIADERITDAGLAALAPSRTDAERAAGMVS